MSPSRNECDRKARPVLLEYTSESMERIRQEELYQPASRTFQWCLAPFVFIATMASFLLIFSFIPASVLLMNLLQSQNLQAGSMQYGITLIPTLSVGVDIMGIGVVLVSIMGLFGVAKGCRRLMNLYFGFVLVFIAVQLGSAVFGFINGTSWVQDALEKSWSKAYETDKGLIQDLQDEFVCKGFKSDDDMSTPTSRNSDIYLPPCAEILQTRFGQRLQRLGSIVLCIRMIQLTGVLLLSILFRHLASVDQSDDDIDEDRSDEESLYFKSEKQIEDEDARVPLLLEEDDEDLPDYYSDDDEEDEEKMYGGEYTSDYEYQDLPEYVEDEREAQVYVA
ncbi:hypothetical protein BGZ76_011766 [Entomortierella beljakovae]|nr:hypothetical protein BGZ76_011766 [Entomortierella beljakovae]